MSLDGWPGRPQRASASGKCTTTPTRENQPISSTLLQCACASTRCLSCSKHLGARRACRMTRHARTTGPGRPALHYTMRPCRRNHLARLEAPTQSGQDQRFSLALRREFSAEATLELRVWRPCVCGLLVIAHDGRGSGGLFG